MSPLTSRTASVGSRMRGSTWSTAWQNRDVTLAPASDQPPTASSNSGRNAIGIYDAGRRALPARKPDGHRSAKRGPCLDRRAVARPDSADLAGKEGRAVEIRADDLVGARVGAGDGAEELRRHPAFAHRRHGPAILVRRLALELRPVDGAPVQPRRRPGLEPGERQLEIMELVRQRRRGPFPDPAAGTAAHAEMKLAAEEGAGGEDRLGAGLAVLSVSPVIRRPSRCGRCLTPRGARPDCASTKSWIAAK